MLPLCFYCDAGVLCYDAAIMLPLSNQVFSGGYFSAKGFALGCHSNFGVAPYWHSVAPQCFEHDAIAVAL